MATDQTKPVRDRIRRPRNEARLSGSPMLVRFKIDQADQIRTCALKAGVSDVDFVRNMMTAICTKMIEAQSAQKATGTVERICEP